MGQDIEACRAAADRLAQLVEQHKGSDLVEIPVPRQLIEHISAEAHEMMDHLQTAHKQLMQSEKMAMLGQLMAGIAHEVNTPIASINSNIDLIARSLDKIKTMLSSAGMEERPETAAIVRALSVLEKLNQSNKTACDRVVQTVRSLRSFTRADITELRKIDIHDELENALVLVHHEIKGRIKITKEFGDIPECNCFPNRLNGVFVNMLVNAAQAIDGEGEITIETSRSGETIEVKFTDTGQGIPPENLGRLFDPGFTTKPPDEGTGLGLAICKRIIEEHHGDIKVESEVGKGTTFTITLPIEHEAADGKPSTE